MSIRWNAMIGLMLLLSMMLLLAGGMAMSNKTSEKAAFNMITEC